MLVDERGSESLLSNAEDKRIWDAYERLDPKGQAILTDRMVPVIIQRWENAWHLSSQETGVTSLALRKIFLSEWALSECESKMLALLGGQSSRERVQAILSGIQSEIFTLVPEPVSSPVREEEQNPTIESRQIPLLEALATYPQLGQQTITEARVKLRASVEPMRGSLLNWLRAYREELGVGYHDAMVRGQFLFHSPNGSKLSNEEHERVGLILRSLDDSERLEIDPVHQVVIFPTFSTVSGGSLGAFPVGASAERGNLPLVAAEPSQGMMRPTERMSPGGSPALVPATSGDFSQNAQPERHEPFLASEGGTMHFSSNHVLPAERGVPLSTSLVPVVPQRAAALSTQGASPSFPTYIPKPFRIDPTSRRHVEGE